MATVGRWPTAPKRWALHGRHTQHADRITEMEPTFTATPVLSTNGEQITGWNLSGAVLANEVLAATGVPADVTTCPDGSSLDFRAPMSIKNLAGKSTYTNGGLTVNGIDLPNTPVEVAPVA